MTTTELAEAVAYMREAPPILSALVALVLPAVIILIRKNLRAERVAAINEIENAFNFDNGIPSFELVKSKYSNAPVPPGGALYLSAIPYIAVSAFGLLTIFTPISNILSPKSNFFPTHLSVILFAGFDPESLDTVAATALARPGAAVASSAPDTQGEAKPTGAAVAETPSGASLSTTTPVTAAAAAVAQADSPGVALAKAVGTVETGAVPCPTVSCKEIGRAATVLAFTFAGAIIFSLSYLIRAVGNFELSPVAFLRVTMHMLFAVAVAMALWRVLKGIPGGAYLNGIYYGVAFMIGFFPEFGTRLLVSKLALPAKASRTDLIEKSPSVSTEIIDGINSAIAFRLQEQQIEDVQNLATFNPIMLHVETPYGLYESIDWVAQAQLCTVVGPDTFLVLRKRGMRTIFDLERMTEKGSPALRAELARLIFNYPKADRQAAASDPAGAQQTDPVDNDLKVMFKVILDDLHVHRLRQIWTSLEERLKPSSPEPSASRQTAP